MISLRFRLPGVTTEQLSSIADTFSLDKTEDPELLKDKCFEKAFQACERGDWSLIDRADATKLSLLADKIGRTLLIKAVMQQKDSIVLGLVARTIGLTTTDRLGKNVLDYLAYSAAGRHSSKYSDLILAKFNADYSQGNSNKIIMDFAGQLDCSIMGGELLIDITLGNVPPKEGIELAKGIIDNDRSIFGCIHLRTLEFMKCLENLQRSENISEAESTRKEYHYWHSVLLGIEPLDRVLEDELKAKAQNGQDRDVDQFLTSFAKYSIDHEEMPSTTMGLITDLAMIYFCNQRYERALRTLTPILLWMQEAEEQKSIIFQFTQIMAAIGNCCLTDYRGLKTAEDLFNQARELCEGSPIAELLLYLQYLGRGSLYMTVGQIDLAENDFKKAIDFAEKSTSVNKLFYLSLAYTLLSSILIQKWEKGGMDFDQQICSYIEKSCALCDNFNTFVNKDNEKYLPDGFRELVCFMVLWNPFKILVACGKDDQALKIVELLSQILNTSNSKNEIIKFLKPVFKNLVSQHPNFDLLLDGMKSIYDNLDYRDQERAVAAVQIGKAYLNMDNFGEAAQWFEKAAKIFAKLQSDLPYDEWQITIFEQQIEAYKCWEHSLLHLNQTTKALVVSDSRKARALGNILHQRVSFNKDLPLDLTLDEMFDVARKNNTTFVVYSNLENGNGHCWVITPYWGMYEANINTNVFSDGIDAFLPEALYRSHDQEPSFSLAGLCKQLNEKDTEPPLSKESIQGEMRGKEEKIQIALLKLREKMHNFLKKCYQEFIKPIETFLPNSPEQTVTFIPDGPMALIPFAILERADGKYFVEAHSWLVAPSIKSVSLLEKLRKQRSGKETSGTSIVVGNPEIHKDLKLKPLPYAELESIEVGKLLGTAKVCLKIGSGATIESVISKMQQAQWIHCACHGSYAKKEGSVSAYSGLLYLSPDQDHPEGKLFAEEISKIKFEAELAFLSACYSGRGDNGHLHEGLIGFTRALVSGGVLTSISSYWRLPDSEETMELIKTFYNHVLGNGVSKVGKAVALRQAMLKAIQKNREDPHKWGALFLTGLN